MEIVEMISALEKTNPEIASSLGEYQATFGQNVARINKLELDLQTAAEKRDKLKTIIRSATGLEEITEDSLKGVLAKGDDEKVVGYKKDIETLQHKLSENDSVVEGIKNKYESDIFNLRLERSVSMIGAKDEVHSPHAYNIVLNELAKGAIFEDGNVIYKNEDGSTKFGKGGQTATIMSVYEDLKANPEFSYIFKEQYKTGGGKKSLGPKSDASGHSLRRSKMSDDEKRLYIEKHKIEAYKQLPL
jgi:hypothetical protein